MSGHAARCAVIKITEVETLFFKVSRHQPY